MERIKEEEENKYDVVGVVPVCSLFIKFLLDFSAATVARPIEERLGLHGHHHHHHRQ